jgi:hypothetical protein
VLASYGHVRDLAEKPGSVKPEADFEMVWSTAGFAGRQRGLADIVAAIEVGLSCLAWPLCAAARYFRGMQYHATAAGGSMPEIWWVPSSYDCQCQ